MGEVGSQLRDAREELGLSLQDVEKATRIRYAFLEALEEGQYSRLPGTVYARGLLRNYASYLNLDPDALVAEAGLVTGPANAEVPRVLNEPLLHRSRAGQIARIILVLLLILVALGGIWLLYGRYTGGEWPWPASRFLASRDETVPTVEPTRPEQNVPAASETVVPTAIETTAIETMASSPTLDPSPTLQGPAATVVATEAATLSSTAMPAAVNATSPVTMPNAITVTVETMGFTYLRVVADDVTVYETMAEAGLQETWSARESLALRIGDAADVRVLLNGQDVGPVGEAEEVVDLEYTREDVEPGA